MSKMLIIFFSMMATTIAAEPAAPLGIDRARVTVSGLSAGGQMAHQLHIAYSDLFSGAGMLAGGPHGCAAGSVATAMTRCMGKVDGELPVDEMAAEIRSAAADGRVAPIESLADDRIWLFHGTLDSVVASEVSNALAELYTGLVPEEQIKYVNDMEAEHHFPTKDQGSDCTTSASPFLGRCDYDAAGELLGHLYPGLTKPQSEASVDLTETALPGAGDAGLSETAWLFVPPECREEGASCALHLVLHGCAQSALKVGTAFIEGSGYLPWAEANGIVLAFPQVEPSPLNPFACWDWWGYTGPGYLWRGGAQMAVLTEWISSL
jgi:poly(3-hydroxybutyrate) depolymerase